MKRIIFLLVIAIFAAGAAAQAPAGFDLANYGVRIDPDKRVTIVLATLNMAATRRADGSFEPVLNPPLSPEGIKFRDQLWADNVELPEDLRLKIINFVAAFKRRNAAQTDAEIIAPFVSMAYTLTDAPELGDPVVTNDLPGNLLDVLDFAPLVREFYRRSAIGSKLDSYLKEYRLAADKTLRPSSRDMISGLLGYLHTRPILSIAEKVKVETSKQGSKKQTVQGVVTRHVDRHFYVVPEALSPKGTLNFLNIGDDYYLIVAPDTDLSGSDGRRAFLRFVIDPLILRNPKELAPIRQWTTTVLDEVRRTNPSVTTDTFLAISRSLAAAIDIRQRYSVRVKLATDQARRNLAAAASDAEKRKVTDELNRQRQSYEDERALELYEDYVQGNVLSFFFADELVGMEESGFDIASSLREMMASFDAAKQSGYVAATAEARRRAEAARAARRTTAGTIVADNPVTARLVEIQKVIDARDLVKAAADLKSLLAQYPSEPRIYYNIGRVASLAAAKIEAPDAQAAKLLEAKTAYGNVLNTATPDTDKALLSLTYVALGRIYEFYGEKETALKLYDQAIKLGDITNGAHQDALAAKQNLLKP